MRLLIWVGLCLTLAIGSASAPIRPQALAQSTNADAVVVDFRGPIQRIGAARWRVAEHEINITGDTTVVEREGLTAPGMWAHVQAIWQDGGRLTTQQIETAQTMSLRAPSSSLLGVIANIAPDHWLVGETRVEVAVDTQILGAPEVGGTAFVRLRYEANGQVTALTIVTTMPDQTDITLLKGVVVRYGDEELELAMESLGALIQIDKATLIEGIPAVDAFVEVVAWISPEEELRAALITVIDPLEQRAPFKGRLILQVTATDPEQWSILVSGAPGQPWQVQNLLVDLDTAIVDERNGSIRPGVWIEGLADEPAQAGLPWIARTVRGQSSSSVERSGVVRSMDNNSGLQFWQMGDQAAIVDRATYVDGAPGVGRYALVRGTMLSENTIWATEARTRYVLRGWLTSRSDNTSPRQWLIDVPRSAAPHDAITGRVAVVLDSSSLVHPALDNGVLNVFVEVQACASRQGWLVETARLADFSVQ